MAMPVMQLWGMEETYHLSSLPNSFVICFLLSGSNWVELYCSAPGPGLQFDVSDGVGWAVCLYLSSYLWQRAMKYVETPSEKLF